MKTLVIQADEPYSVEQLIAWCNASSTERSPEVISLFICMVSPSCILPILPQNRRLSRIDLDLITGDMSIWELVYDPDNPNYIIEDAIDIRQLASQS